MTTRIFRQLFDSPKFSLPLTFPFGHDATVHSDKPSKAETGAYCDGWFIKFQRVQVACSASLRHQEVVKVWSGESADCTRHAMDDPDAGGGGDGGTGNGGSGDEVAQPSFNDRLNILDFGSGEPTTTSSSTTTRTAAAGTPFITRAASDAPSTTNRAAAGTSSWWYHHRYRPAIPKIHCTNTPHSTRIRVRVRVSGNSAPSD